MLPDRPSPEPAGRPRATLLVFTLDAASERARRRLLPDRLGDWELALYRESLDAALEAGRATGCRLAVCSPGRLRLPADVAQITQEGRGFATRLRRAIAHQAPAPERPLVVVGSDIPGLAPRHVAAAQDRLAERPDRLVVGPSPDGGFYLLAAARPVDELLGEVAWLRHDTLASLLAAARRRGIEVALLEPLADLDRAADFAALLARRATPIISWLGQLVAELRRLCRPPAPAALGRPLPARVPIRPGRGPPG